MGGLYSVTAGITGTVAAWIDKKAQEIGISKSKFVSDILEFEMKREKSSEDEIIDADIALGLKKTITDFF